MGTVKGAPEAIVKLLDRARSHVSVKNVGPMVAFDPGAGGYAAMFEPIIAKGLPAIQESDCCSFDFTETVGLTRWGMPNHEEERWFRIVTCTATLIARALDKGDDEPPLAYSLVALLVDAYALAKNGGQRTLLGLLDSVFVETLDIRQDYGEPGDHCFAVLARLLVSKHAAFAEQEELCRELDSRFQQTQSEDLPDGSHNPYFEMSDDYIWGLTCFDQCHSVWLTLVEEHFPSPSSALLEEVLTNLLAGGARWERQSPVLR